VTAPVGGIAEAEKAAAAFQVALVRLGITTVVKALALWKRVPANRLNSAVESWLRDATTLTMQDRDLARELALGYYRLNRALRTGFTVPDSNRSLPQTTTLGDLRREYRVLLEQVNAASEKAATDRTGATGVATPKPYRGGSESDTTDVPVEDIPGIDSEGDSEQTRITDDAEQETRLVLAAMSATFRKAVNAIDTDRPATEVDAERDALQATAGARQAAAIERLVMNGGRNQLTSLAERDSRVIGYVRASRTGTPCGWCAMLISRGLVLYSSEESAVGKTVRARSVKDGNAEVGDQYHDNCHCYAEPVYSKEEFGESRYDLNRQYAKLWPRVTKGLSGKAALSAWRRFIRQEQKTPTTNAQAA
jgi:hypothetical protein